MSADGGQHVLKVKWALSRSDPVLFVSSLQLINRWGSTCLRGSSRQCYTSSTTLADAPWRWTILSSRASWSNHWRTHSNSVTPTWVVQSPCRTKISWRWLFFSSHRRLVSQTRHAHKGYDCVLSFHPLNLYGEDIVLLPSKVAQL